MAPTKAPPRIIIFDDSGLSPVFFCSGIIFFNKWEIVQKRNIMVKALAKAEAELIIIATFSVSPVIREKTRPMIINKGAPGGCPTWSLNELAINSPQSH